MQKKIAIDINLTITKNIDVSWYHYLIESYREYLTYESYEQFVKDYENGCAEYNITKYFNLPEHIDDFAYWKQSYLYEDQILAEGCYEVVKNLWQAGFEIYFISVTEPAHMKSKKDYLVRSFDFMDNINFVATDVKHCMDGCFAIVDDRLDNIIHFEDENTLRILFDTPYKQDVKSTQDYKLAKNWQDVEDFIVQHIEENI